jgi:ubiquitin-conjugating enzyme E2 Q
MPRKAYIADLKQLTSAADIEGISNVRSGEDDGEFCFKVEDAIGSLWEISALIPGKKQVKTLHTWPA